MLSDKKIYLHAIVLVAVILAVGIYTVAAPSWEVPRTIHYQGRLFDLEGNPIEGQRDITFRLWDDATATGEEHILWQDELRITFEDGGYFSIELGATGGNAFPDGLFEASGMWLGVEVDESGELSPRQRIHSVPYALKAGETAAIAEGTELDQGTVGDENLADVIQALRDEIEALKNPTPSCPDHAGEMVIVGNMDDGHAAFCIDKYEISIWPNADCTGSQKGKTDDDYGSGFPDNGNWLTPLYACSISDVPPSRSMTWFQAQQACVLSGKRLCTNAEWQASVAGTPDDSSCNTSGGASRNTGNGTCVSNYEAEDMIGNLSEWVALWEMEPGWNGGTPLWGDVAGTSYGSDVYNHGGLVTSPARGEDGSHEVFHGGTTARLPAAVWRGGCWSVGTRAGAFAVGLGNGPSSDLDILGARCCANVK